VLHYINHYTGTSSGRVTVEKMMNYEVQATSDQECAKVLMGYEYVRR
jgi:hypothetical protein